MQVLRSQKHPTGMFLMGSPCAPLAPARRAFQLQTAAAVCHQKTRRPSSRVPPSVQGGGLPTFFFSFKKKVGQRKMRPSERCFARCDGRPGLCPWTPPPFGKGGRKLYRPSAPVKGTSPTLQAPPEGRGVHGGTGPPVRRSGARWDALADR